MIFRKILMLGVALSVLFCTGAEAASRYTVTEIAPQQAVVGRDAVLNDQGQVLARARREDATWFHFLWDEKQGFRLLDEEAIQLGATRLEEVTALNAAGNLIGLVHWPSPLCYGCSSPFFWNGQGLHLIPQDEDELTIPIAMNRHNQVLLARHYGGGEDTRWSIWSPHGEQPVAVKSKVAYPVALNDQGQVLFESLSPRELLVWHNGKVVRRIAAPKGTFTQVIAFNNVGDIIGELLSERGDTPMLWTHTGHQIKIARPGYQIQLSDLNDQLELVGEMTTNSSQVAILWNPIDELVNLNGQIDPQAGWVLERALAINAGGKILANAHTLSDPSQQRLVLLAPV